MTDRFQIWRINRYLKNEKFLCILPNQASRSLALEITVWRRFCLNSAKFKRWRRRFRNFPFFTYNFGHSDTKPPSVTWTDITSHRPCFRSRFWNSIFRCFVSPRLHISCFSNTLVRPLRYLAPFKVSHNSLVYEQQNKDLCISQLISRLSSRNSHKVTFAIFLRRLSSFIYILLIILTRFFRQR